jgi:hypothetical protein
MADKKLVLTGGVSILLTLLVTLGAINLTSPKLHFCEDRGILMECDKLTQYYGLPNGKCWNSETGNKLCRSGWTTGFEIVDENDYPLPDEGEEEEQQLAPAVITPDDCEECKECPICKNETIYVGGGGGDCDCKDCAPCDSCCPEIDCGVLSKINVIAYTDQGKYFCDGIGLDATCVRNDDLEICTC